MDMICRQCGARMEESSVFCMNCGAIGSAVPVKPAPLPHAAPQSAPARPAPKPDRPVPKPVRPTPKRKKFGKKGIFISAAVLVVLVVAAVLLFREPSRPYTAALDKAFTYDYSRTKENLEALAPEAYWEVENPSTGDLIYGPVIDIPYSDSEFYEEFLGEELEFSYDFKDVTPYSQTQVAIFGDRLEEKYDIDADSVTEALHLVFDMTVQGENGVQKRHALSQNVIKIDGEWYCFTYYYSSHTLHISFQR